MIPILELSDKDFKAAIIKVLQLATTNIKLSARKQKYLEPPLKMLHKEIHKETTDKSKWNYKKCLNNPLIGRNKENRNEKQKIETKNKMEDPKP